MDDVLYSTFAEVEDCHWWFVARREILFSLLRTRIHLPDDAEILDVGCGTGATLQALSQRYKAFGIDPSSLAIDQCRARGLANAAVGTLEEFPFPGKSFDLIAMLDVIEHIDDDVAALQLAKKLLKDGGHILLTVPAFQFLWSKHDEINQHKRRYAKRVLKECLEKSGYTVDFISYYNTFLFPLAFVERVFEKILRTDASIALKIPPAPLNALFTRLFGCERWWLEVGPFPFGLSLLAIVHPK
jgi:SAM-dependent methyltransferase